MVETVRSGSGPIKADLA